MLLILYLIIHTITSASFREYFQYILPYHFKYYVYTYILRSVSHRFSITIIQFCQYSKNRPKETISQSAWLCSNKTLLKAH